MNAAAGHLPQIFTTRLRLVELVSGFSANQVQYKPTPETWSMVDNIEHLVWAEMGGINGMWRALEGIRAGKPVWEGVHKSRGQHIEVIIERTWKPNEVAPETARPRWGGTMPYWLCAFKNCDVLLNELVAAVRNIDPETIIYPHPISGPLDMLQRLQFLRFHMERHEKQIDRLATSPGFPSE